VSSFAGDVGAQSVLRVMKTHANHDGILHEIEGEYCERNGVLHVSRAAGLNHKVSRQQELYGSKGVSSASRSQMITDLSFSLPEDSPVLGDMRFHSLLVPHSDSLDVSAGSARGGDQAPLLAFQAMLKASISAEKLVPEAVKLVNKQIVASCVGLPTWKNRGL
jgi:hypothetical protein